VRPAGAVAVGRRAGPAPARRIASRPVAAFTASPPWRAAPGGRARRGRCAGGRGGPGAFGLPAVRSDARLAALLARWRAWATASRARAAVWRAACLSGSRCWSGHPAPGRSSPRSRRGRDGDAGPAAVAVLTSMRQPLLVAVAHGGRRPVARPGPARRRRGRRSGCDGGGGRRRGAGARRPPDGGRHARRPRLHRDAQASRPGPVARRLDELRASGARALRGRGLAHRPRPATTRPARRRPGPELRGITARFNTGGEPLTLASLRGRVVLLDFWTYSCVNCLRTIPELTALDARYRADGLTVLGVHTPEFAFEAEPGNVGRAVRELGIRYPGARPRLRDLGRLPQRLLADDLPDRPRRPRPRPPRRRGRRRPHRGDRAPAPAWPRRRRRGGGLATGHEPITPGRTWGASGCGGSRPRTAWHSTAPGDRAGRARAPARARR
jgi:thiol-disulfide isomerase/thioredoxin